MLVALVAASIPRPPPLPGNPSDKIQHLLAFICLAGLSTAAYPKIPALKIALGLTGFGALIEMVQLIPALHRDADVLDWVVDTVAAAAVITAMRGWRRIHRS